MNLTVLRWLEHTVARCPHKTAFTDSSQSLTFAQFDHITKSIGSYLAARVPAGSPVVVMSGRHVRTPAAFLGVVRAGCFYAPIDATMPAGRLNQILGVIRAEYMLVDDEFLELARELNFSGEIIPISTAESTPIHEELLQRASASLLPSSPLYVIFTSG